MPKKGSRAATAERRKKVGELYLQHYTQQQIADQLGVAQSTISRDVQKVLDLWKAEQLDTIDKYVSRELRQLALYEREVYRLWQEAEDSRYMQLLLSISDKRSKLLGLDQPAKSVSDVKVSIEYEDPLQEDPAAAVAVTAVKLPEDTSDK